MMVFSHTAEEIITGAGIYKSFPSAGSREQLSVLKGIDLQIQRGSFTGIVGPSGSGKSTLLNCLAGLEPLTSGTVTIAGTDISSLRGNKLVAFRRDHLGFVFQSYNLIPALTAYENVLLPAQLAGLRHAHRRAREALHAVHMLDFSRSLPNRLSGGQAQRVAIARALASGAELIFADEPTGALDTKTGNLVLDILRRLVDEEHRTIVMVTHDLEAASRTDTVFVMRDGTLHETLESPHTPEILAALDRAATYETDAS